MVLVRLRAAEGTRGAQGRGGACTLVVHIGPLLMVELFIACRERTGYFVVIGEEGGRACAWDHFLRRGHQGGRRIGGAWVLRVRNEVGVRVSGGSCSRESGGNVTTGPDTLVLAFEHVGVRGS